MATATRLITKIGGLTLGLAAILGILAWLLGAFHETEQPGPAGPTLRQAPPGARTVQVQTREVKVTESAVGTIHPVHRVSVGAKLLARVKVMHVEKAGVRVRKGQVLAELDDSDLQARLAQAEAALVAATAQRDQSQVERDRARQLYEKKVEPKAALDAAETRLSTAEADVTRSEQAVAFARAQMDYARIEAPMDGIVIDKEVEAGDLVSPGQTLVTLYDPDKMQLVARVRERLAMRLRPGRDVAVTIEALDLECHGRIDQIVPEAQASSRVFEVRVTGPCPPGIYAGMFGRLHIPIGNRTEVRIPETAVRRVGQMETVYVRRDDGSLLRRFVQTGHRDGDEVEVLTGLEPGETILARARDAVR